MKTSRIPRALTFIGLATFASSVPCADQKTAPPCTELQGKLVTLRGKVSRTWDNMSPDTDFGDVVVVDPKEEVVLVTLRRPICIADEEASPRPVVQTRVTVVELVLNENLGAVDLDAHVGHERTLEGTLSENVWWHYRATMRIAARSIKK